MCKYLFVLANFNNYVSLFCMKESLSLEEMLDWYVEAGVIETAGKDVYMEFNDDEKSKNVSNSVLKSPRVAISQLAQSTNSALDKANSICASVSSLEELKEKLLAFEGCALKQTASNTVFGYGNSNAKVMFIGEAPGADEDRIGMPFVAKIGQLLEKMINSVGLDKNDCYVANVLPWRPPGNRTPLDAEIAVCLPFLQKQIDLVNPDVICMLGGSAANALLGINDPISKLRGKWFEYVKDNSEKAAVMATFYPGYLLSNPAQKAKAWADMLTLMKKL